MSYHQTFRLNQREIMYDQYARINKKMGVNQIGDVTARSDSTIQHHVEFAERSGMLRIDNRRNSPTVRRKGRWAFLDKLPVLKIGFKLFVTGFIEKVEDAFNPIMIALFGKVASENTSAEEDLDPS